MPDFIIGFLNGALTVRLLDVVDDLVVHFVLEDRVTAIREKVPVEL